MEKFLLQLSRDNLLNSSDNLTTPESPQSLQNSDVVIDTTDIILVESNNVPSSRYVNNVQSPAPALRGTHLGIFRKSLKHLNFAQNQIKLNLNSFF